MDEAQQLGITEDEIQSQEAQTEEFFDHLLSPRSGSLLADYYLGTEGRCHTMSFGQVHVKPSCRCGHKKR